MPAMILYNYGKGRVLATTLYSDMATSLYQETNSEKILLRDLIAWSEEKTTIQSYAPGEINVPIYINNPNFGPLEYPVQEFATNAQINLQINVSNTGNSTSDTVAFALFDPNYDLSWLNVTEAVTVNQSKLVSFSYPMSPDSKSGIWSIFYLLLSDREIAAGGWGEMCH
jgi:hypothetical protein